MNEIKVTHRLIYFMLVLLLTILLMFGWSQKQKRAMAASATYEIYVVKSGDTLWSISKQYIKGDPRGLVYDIEKINNVKPEELMPGQELKIPLGEN